MFSLLLVFSCLFHFFSFAPMYSWMQVLTSARVILPSPLVSRGSLAAMVWPRARQISARSYLSMSPSASTSQVSGATPLPLSTMASSVSLLLTVRIPVSAPAPEGLYFTGTVTGLPAFTLNGRMGAPAPRVKSALPDLVKPVTVQGRVPVLLIMAFLMAFCLALLPTVTLPKLKASGATLMSQGDWGSRPQPQLRPQPRHQATQHRYHCRIPRQSERGPRQRIRRSCSVYRQQ